MTGKKNISDERLDESSANQIKIFEDHFSTTTNHFLPVGPAKRLSRLWHRMRVSVIKILSFIGTYKEFWWLCHYTPPGWKLTSDFTLWLQTALAWRKHYPAVTTRSIPPLNAHYNAINSLTRIQPQLVTIFSLPFFARKMTSGNIINTSSKFHTWFGLSTLKLLTSKNNL